MIKEIIRPDHCIRVCDICGDEKKVNYYNVKKKEKHLCITCSNRVNYDKKKNAYKPWNIGKTYQKCSGKYYVNKAGYRLYYIGDKTYKGGYVAEHRIIIELHLKRRLVKGEVIHHIDGDKTNNDINNLLLANPKTHKIVHNNLESVSFELVQRGIISFDNKNNTYRINEKIISKLPELEVKKDMFPLGNTKEKIQESIKKWSMLK